MRRKGARQAADPFPRKCPSCGVPVGSVPCDQSGRPKLMVCYSHDPPALFCEECRGPHASCGVLRRSES
jgi:hypothetical protein